MKNITQQQKEFNELVKDYIIDSIDSAELETVEEKLQFLWDTFETEYCNPYVISKEKGQIHKVFKNWMLSMPNAFNVEYDNLNIIRLLIKWGGLNDNPTQHEISVAVNQYWDILTRRAFCLLKDKQIITN